MNSKNVLITFSIVCCSCFAMGQQTITGTLMYDGTVRNYRLYIPSGYSSAGSFPLVFNLHGYTSNAEQQEFYSEMNVVAEANNFLVCYPNGIGNAWNVNWNFGSTADDVGFISALIDALADDYAINLSRVYSCGMSNGGFMSYRLACELNDRIAAIASVTGSMVPGYVCTPGKPVPVLEIHGTADLTVPYNGLAGLCINIDDVVAFWANNNNCEANPDTIAIENSSTLDLCTATRYDFNECENSKVSLIKINGGAHTWPGASFILGTTNQDISASEEIWAFFNQFELGGFATPARERNIENELVIYPNPAGDFIQLNAGDSFSGGYFEITNNFSQRIIQGKLTEAAQSLQVGHLQPGIYYLTVRKNGLHTGSIFIKN